MSVLVTGSVAIDHIMVFLDRFDNHILPDQLHILNVAFEVPTLERRWGGTGANIAFNLLRTVGDLPVVGPITLGLAKPAHMLQPHSRGVKDMVHLTAISSLSPTPARRPELLLS